MSDKTMHPWFRFQLLTLMLMTLTAGGFVYLNTLPGAERSLRVLIGGTTALLAVAFVSEFLLRRRESRVP